MEMIRVPNWSSKLVAFAEVQRKKNFEWGETDCGSLIRKGLKLVFGKPILDVDEYSNEREAEKVMKKLGDASSFFESQGAVNELLSRASGGDVVVRPGVDDGLPRLGLFLYPDALLTSDPEYGPHVIKAYELKRQALLYKFV